MKWNTLQLRLTLWFAASVLTVTAVFVAISYLHLRHELSVEQRDRVHPGHTGFVLHGTYSKEEVNDIAGHILNVSLMISLPAALFAIFTGGYLARKSLRPVASINSQLQAIKPHQLNDRIHTPDADAELETITRNINDLLARTEAAYRDIAEFSAQVAHELRTPLTLMRLQLEESSARIDPPLAEGLQDELSRLENYVEQCLLIARAERNQIEARTECLRLRPLIEDVIEPFSLLAREENRLLQPIFKEDGTVRVSAWILRQILHNLLNNALRHGVGTIDLLTDATPDAICIQISNRIRPSSAKSTGLGLRIVTALAKTQPRLHVHSHIAGDLYTANVSLPLSKPSAE